MDVCRRKDCGHPGQSHQHYRSGTDCSQCLCVQYQAADHGRALLTRLGFSLAAALVAAAALALLATGYTGPALVWLGVGVLGLLWTGRIIADRGQDGGPR